MKFIGREDELARLKSIEEKSKKFSKMTVVTGRRRIGKTKLIKEVYENQVYFFVSKKDESLLCGEFVEILQNTLHVKILGNFTKFENLFEQILELSKTRHLTLCIDEFQEFFYVNKTVFSAMQNLWDRYKDETKLNLILCGSIYSLMKRIFENSHEPLFNRANYKINLKPFDVNTLKDVFKKNAKTYKNEDLLSLYAFSGGVAKYVETFMDEKAYTFESQLDLIFDGYSFFLDEGKNILIEEFGKEYGVYFSILSLIANSKTSRSEIEGILEKNIGGYLDRLENEYTVIKKVKPFGAKEGTRVQKYAIEDNFLSFWFRFIYKYKSSIEIENYEFVKEIIKRDFSIFCGRILEKYFTQKLQLSKKYSQMGTYWEKGNQNEIDIVAINEVVKSLLLTEVKLNPKKINLQTLKDKSTKLVQRYRDYEIIYKGFSLEDL